MNLLSSVVARFIRCRWVASGEKLCVLDDLPAKAKGRMQRTSYAHDAPGLLGGPNASDLQGISNDRTP